MHLLPRANGFSVSFPSEEIVTKDIIGIDTVFASITEFLPAIAKNQPLRDFLAALFATWNCTRPP
jgi:hypothetical protein